VYKTELQFKNQLTHCLA